MFAYACKRHLFGNKSFLSPCCSRVHASLRVGLLAGALQYNWPGDLLNRAVQLCCVILGIMKGRTTARFLIPACAVYSGSCVSL